ncbi:unnamed protein product, partial [Schistocephalus solidus]|uniref:UNC80 domain-containing protein n=1 Tax=Schistocephalus solidus TaxID=70667 RepID=A0A183TSC3_SCHSO
KTFVTASTSRRKQQQELLARAVSAAKAQEDEARRVFHMTTCPVLELASAEAAFSKDHREEASAEDVAAAQLRRIGRRVGQRCVKPLTRVQAGVSARARPSASVVAHLGCNHRHYHRRRLLLALNASPGLAGAGGGGDGAVQGGRREVKSAGV